MRSHERMRTGKPARTDSALLSLFASSPAHGVGLYMRPPDDSRTTSNTAGDLASHVFEFRMLRFALSWALVHRWRTSPITARVCCIAIARLKRAHTYRCKEEFNGPLSTFGGPQLKTDATSRCPSTLLECFAVGRNVERPLGWPEPEIAVVRHGQRRSSTCSLHRATPDQALKSGDLVRPCPTHALELGDQFVA